MNAKNKSRMQEALDVIERMPIEDQLAVVEVLQHRLIEHRRSEIARNALLARQAVQENRARYGDIDDLKRDLSS